MDAEIVSQQLDQPPDLSHLFNGLSPSQQRYLAQLPVGHQTFAACNLAGIAVSTVKKWRGESQAFKGAERAIKESASSYGSMLASNLAKAVSPTVMDDMIHRSIAPVVSDRQLVTKQKAAETVLKAAGVLSDVPGITGVVERVDVLAMRLWVKKKEPQG